MLELMARGGMRIGEVLEITPDYIADNKLIIHSPKSGKELEVDFIPKKLMTKLNEYVADYGINPSEKIFPISYTAAWIMVKKAGKIIGVNLAP